VAIIADGSRRWASRRGLAPGDGHRAAADTLKARVADALELGIEELAVYVFSTENWSRPVGEVSELMEMLSRRIALEAPELRRWGVSLRFLGRRDGLPPELIEQIDGVRSLAARDRRLTLLLAIDYGGRTEILQAARRFDGVSEEDFRRCLYAPDMHDPEVIIRTGGEQRLSNYLLWQSAYAELVFRDELWPDFTRGAFRQALAEFNDRGRRFGGR
jgi:undecaprenyl diphosphate synthase